MPPRRKESPVKVGDKVFVVYHHATAKFDIEEGVVTDNPSDHIWVKHRGVDFAQFYGPHSWALTEPEARKLALDLVSARRSQLNAALAELKITEAKFKSSPQISSR